MLKGYTKENTQNEPQKIVKVQEILLINVKIKTCKQYENAEAILITK